jgi:hypothetical protein
MTLVNVKQGFKCVKYEPKWKLRVKQWASCLRRSTKQTSCCDHEHNKKFQQLVGTRKCLEM